MASGTGRPRAGLRGVGSLLRRNPEFTRLYVAQLVSFGGDWFLTVALLGLVLELTGSPLLTALVVVAHLVPFFVMAPLAGVLADRLDRKRLMVAADIARAFVCLGFLFIDGPADVWMVYVFQGVLAVLEAVFEPASAAAVPNVVDRADLPQANVLIGSAWGTMLAVGAALGGLVSATFGRDVAYVADSASFVVSASLLVGIRRPFSEAREEAHPPMREAVVETIAYARREPRVFALLAVKGGFGLAGGVILLLPVFATQVFQAGDAGIGILMGARGLGAFIGPFIGRLYIGDDERRLFTAIGVSLAAFAGFYAVFPLMGTLWAAAAFAFGAHLGGGAQWTLSTYGLQTIVPDRIRGRVFAFDYMLVTASIATSNLAVGFAADRVDPRWVMAAMAGVALIYAIVWRSLATRALRRVERMEADSPVSREGPRAEAEGPRAEGPRAEARRAGVPRRRS